MIVVRPIEDKREQERLCAVCGIPYLPNALAYRAEDDDAFAGMCQFGMDAAGGHLYHVARAPETTLDDALFIMGRAALNFIDLCGVHTADYTGPVTDAALLSRIGFKQTEDERFCIDLNGFFEHPCQH